MNGRTSKLLRKKARQVVGAQRTTFMVEVFKQILKMPLHTRFGIAWRIIWRIG